LGNQKVQCHVQVAELEFSQRVHGVTLRHKVHSYEIHKTLNVNPSSHFSKIEISQLSWFNHVSRMSQERLTRQVLLLTPTGKQPKGLQEPGGMTCISNLV